MSNQDQKMAEEETTKMAEMQEMLDSLAPDEPSNNWAKAKAEAESESNGAKVIAVHSAKEIAEILSSRILGIEESFEDKASGLIFQPSYLDTLDPISEGKVFEPKTINDLRRSLRSVIEKSHSTLKIHSNPEEAQAGLDIAIFATSVLLIDLYSQRNDPKLSDRDMFITKESDEGKNICSHDCDHCIMVSDN